MFYAFTVGHPVGIYIDWSDCVDVIVDNEGATYHKTWQTLEEATQHMNKTGYQHDEILIHTGTESISLPEYCRRNSLLVPVEVGHKYLKLFDLDHGLHLGVCLYRGTAHMNLSIGEEKMRLNQNQWRKLLSLVSKLTRDLGKVKAGESLHSSYNLGDSVFITITSPNREFHIQFHNAETPGITIREPEWLDILHLKNHLSRAPRSSAEDC
jgi:hypothetical protein